MHENETWFRAVEQGEVAEVRRLLVADPSLAAARREDGMSALMVALYHRRQEVADVLAASRPELDVAEAAAVGDAHRIGELVAVRADCVQDRSPDGFTPLHLACFFDRPHAARTLVDHGADVDAEAANPSRVRPIHSAAAGKSDGCVELLIRHGCTVDATQGGGWTALHAACLHGLGSLVETLLRAGADPLQAAGDGRNAIDMARGAGHDEIVTRLSRT
jgi:adenosylhomocysteine nucleosidase